MPPKYNLEFQNYCRKGLQSDLGVPDHQQRRGFSMQYPDQGPEAFPTYNTSCILHNPSIHCNANENCYIISKVMSQSN